MAETWLPVLNEGDNFTALFYVTVKDKATNSMFRFPIRSQTTVGEAITSTVRFRGYSSSVQCALFLSGRLLQNRDLLQDTTEVYEFTAAQVAGAPHSMPTPSLVVNFPGASFIDANTMLSIEPEPTGDSWRVVNPGLSFRSRCSTSTCKAFQRTIYMNVGFGEIDCIRMLHEVVCPECGQEAIPGDNMGFYRAKFIIKGMNAQREKIVLPQKATSGHEYFTFADRETVSWIYLYAIVEQLN